MNAKDFENHCKNLEGEGQHTVSAELRAYVAQLADATAKTLSLAIRKRKQVGELREALARVEAELAEALGEIRIYQQKFRYIAEGGSFYLSTAAECVRLTSSFLAMHANTAQAEQQEAREPAAAEAIDSLTHPLCVISLRGDDRQKALANDLAKIINRYQNGDQEALGAQVDKFQREDRYIVIKRKDLEKAPFGCRIEFQEALDVLLEHLPKRECLVIESDWPEYEPTLAAIQARMTGQGAQAGDEERPECFCVEHGLHIETLQQQLAEARAALATQPVVPVSAEAMSFEYAHISGERRTVSITREDVIEGMEDALYEKLSDQICRCEPIGETNVVECNCQDYVEEFTLVSAKPAVRGAEHE